MADKAATFAKLFDHSVLRPDVGRDEVHAAAETAVRLGTATLTVQPHYVRFAADLLKGSGVLVGTVVGFPHGSVLPQVKAYETRTLLDLGAQEIDMVMNIPALKNGEHALFVDDIAGVVRAAAGATVKVILETCFLNEEQKRRACRWIADAGAHFVKTSTAYAEGGATLEDVRLMFEAVEGRCQVKAAGGIRQLPEILAYLQAGARRFGSTRTEQFVRSYRALSPAEREPYAEFIADPEA